MSSPYLNLKPRTIRQARAAIARKPDGWTQPTLDDLNEEYRRHAVARNSPEGRAQRAAFAEHAAQEREIQTERLALDLIVGVTR